MEKILILQEIAAAVAAANSQHPRKSSTSSFTKLFPGQQNENGKNAVQRKMATKAKAKLVKRKIKALTFRFWPPVRRNVDILTCYQRSGRGASSIMGKAEFLKLKINCR